MNGGHWIPSEPATQTASEEEILENLAWPRDWNDLPVKVTPHARQGLEELVQLGLPFHIADGRRKFDPYEVFFFMRWAHHTHGHPLWAESLAIGRRLCSEFLPASPAKYRFDLLFERELSLERRKPGLPVRFHFPLPYDDFAQQVISTHPIETADVQFKQDARMLEVRTTVPAQAPRSVRFAVKINFSCGWQGEVIDSSRTKFDAAPETLSRFLAPSEGPIKITQRIGKLAFELSQNATTPWDAVRSFWRFLFTRIVFGRVHQHAIDAQDPLWSIVELGRSDCYYGSALLAALCRARGIPARLVSGYLLYNHIQTVHWWAEIHMPPYGWVPCDLASSILADGDPDSEWSEVFFGRIDARLIIERFPRESLIIELPARESSYMVQFPLDRGLNPGCESVVRELGSNALVYRDRVLARR